LKASIGDLIDGVDLEGNHKEKPKGVGRDLPYGKSEDQETSPMRIRAWAKFGESRCGCLEKAEKKGPNKTVKHGEEKWAGLPVEKPLEPPQKGRKSGKKKPRSFLPAASEQVEIPPRK